MESGRPNILLVDDDELTLQALRRGLHREASIEIAPSASTALVFAAQRKFEVVLTDLVMPGMSGHELIERLATLSPDTICVVLTGTVEPPFPSGLPANVLSCLAKPCPIDALIGALHAALAEYVLRQNRRP